MVNSDSGRERKVEQLVSDTEGGEHVARSASGGARAASQPPRRGIEYVSDLRVHNLGSATMTRKMVTLRRRESKLGNRTDHTIPYRVKTETRKPPRYRKG